MDEPFGAVDPIVRARLQDELVALQRRLHKTIVFVTHDIDEAIRLGDRMAVLNVGGVVEQYGAPVDILAEPANDFVEQFLGAERGLKRLSLIDVRSTPLDPGPVVAPDSTVAHARQVMADQRSDWVAVVNDGHLDGWVAADALDGQATLRDVEVEPFLITLRPDSTLREALDTLLASPTRVAVVLDEQDRYQGVLDVGRIGGGLDA
jgi:osmoprotectant transport system ATP-binding protein